MKMKKIIRIVTLIILILILIILIKLGIDKITKNKFKKILEKNDSNNYELTELTDDEENIVKVNNKILRSENDDTIVWVSEFDSKRVVVDKNKKIAVLTQNDNNLRVSSLNYTYLQDYFNNSDEKFKYLGKEENFYKLSFINKKSGRIVYLYINKDTGIVEKMIGELNGFQIVTIYEVKLNSVSKTEIEYPDLTDYEIIMSSSTGVDDVETMERDE